MRLALMILPALVVAGACSAGARHGESAANGDPTPGQRDFTVGAFHSIALSGSPDVVVTVGGAPSVRAEGPRGALDQLEITVEDGQLRIGTRREGWFSSARDLGHVTIHVATRSLDAASIAGSGNIRVDRAEASDFAGSVSGSGDLDVAALRAGAASFSIAGSGNIHAAGSADRASISIAGSGDARLDDLQTGDASVTLMGSGDTRLRASGEVTGRIMGSGDIYVAGTTRCSVSKMGSGDIHCGG
jgi:hypothetical protein